MHGLKSSLWISEYIYLKGNIFFLVQEAKSSSIKDISITRSISNKNNGHYHIPLSWFCISSKKTEILIFFQTQKALVNIAMYAPLSEERANYLFKCKCDNDHKQNGRRGAISFFITDHFIHFRLGVIFATFNFLFLFTKTAKTKRSNKRAIQTVTTET